MKPSRCAPPAASCSAPERRSGDILPPLFCARTSCGRVQVALWLCAYWLSCGRVLDALRRVQGGRKYSLQSSLIPRPLETIQSFPCINQSFLIKTLFCINSQQLEKGFGGFGNRNNRFPKIHGFAWKSEILAAIFLQMASIIWFSTIPRQAELVGGIN